MFPYIQLYFFKNILIKYKFWYFLNLKQIEHNYMSFKFNIVFIF